MKAETKRRIAVNAAIVLGVGIPAAAITHELISDVTHDRTVACAQYLGQHSLSYDKAVNLCEDLQSTMSVSKNDAGDQVLALPTPQQYVDRTVGDRVMYDDAMPAVLGLCLGGLAVGCVSGLRIELPLLAERHG